MLTHSITGYGVPNSVGGPVHCPGPGMRVNGPLNR
jgi:hypothetical protein